MAMVLSSTIWEPSPSTEESETESEEEEEVFEELFIRLKFHRSLKRHMVSRYWITRFNAEYRKLLITNERERRGRSQWIPAHDYCRLCERSLSQHKCIWPCETFRNNPTKCYPSTTHCHRLHYLPYLGMLDDVTPCVTFELPQTTADKTPTLAFGRLLDYDDHLARISCNVRPEEHGSLLAKLERTMFFFARSQKRQYCAILNETDTSILFTLPKRCILIFHVQLDSALHHSQ